MRARFRPVLARVVATAPAAAALTATPLAAGAQTACAAPVPSDTQPGYTVADPWCGGFDDLVRWVDTGQRPAGDPVLLRTLVAGPTFGCRFTEGQHPNFSAPACP
jgi:hypothetical protein